MARQVRLARGASIGRRLLGFLLAAVLLAACSSEADETTTSTTAPAAEPIAAVTSTTTTVPTTTTTVPSTTTTTTTTTTTLAAIGSLESGLYCRDLVPLGYGYADAVAYWTREGRPDRMDADRNGIPCETVYDAKDVIAFWGEPLPTTTTTTTTIDAWYAVTTPGYDVASLRGSGGNYGSGCSPGSNTLPDGIWFGEIAAADSTRVEFDLMCYGPGPEGGDITNSNPKLRTVPVDAAAVAYRIEPARELTWVPLPYMTWLTITPDPILCLPDGCLEWIYVNDGSVTEIVELFFS
jgi:hypothetical protein